MLTKRVVNHHFKETVSQKTVRAHHFIEECPAWSQAIPQIPTQVFHIEEIRGPSEQVFPGTTGKLLFFFGRDVDDRVLNQHFMETIYKNPASDPRQCVGGQQQKILYVSLPIRGAATNRRKIVYKTYLCVFCTLRISRSSAGVMSPIHVLASTNMDPLQGPHLRIHVLTSLCLRLGSSARSMSPDPYLSGHMYLRILYKIHVFGFMS